MHGSWGSADRPRSVDPVAIPPLAFCGTSTLGIACEQCLYYSLILFFSVEGAHTILSTSFSFFLFSTGCSG